MVVSYLRNLPILMYIILLLSLGLHLLFFIKDPGTIFNKPEVLGFDEEIAKYGSRDAWLYATMAKQLLTEGVYGYDTYHTGEVVKNAFVTPGHPIYLTILFFISSLLSIDEIFFTRIVNMLLSVGTVLLLYHIGTLLFHRIVGLLASALYATYFSPLHYFRTLLTEIPGIFMFTLSLLLFILAVQRENKLFHILFGIVFCITIMIRPTPTPLILLAIGYVLAVFGIRRSISIGLLWLIGPLVIILPWGIRNYIAFGHLYLFSSHGGNSLLNGAIPFFLGDTSHMWIERHELGMTQTEYAKHLMKKGFKEDFTLWFSWYTIGKTIELFRIVDGWIHYYKYKGFFLVNLQHYIVVIGGFLSGIIFSRLNRAVLLLWLLLLGYIGISNIFLTITRYGFFIIPLFCLLLGYGIFAVGTYFYNLITRANMNPSHNKNMK